MATPGEIVSNSVSEGRRMTPSEHPLPIARGIAGDLREWPLFLSLQPEFAKTIRLFCAFGEQGTEVLLITENDEVWGRGSNNHGLLGTGNTTAVPRLLKIPELCGKSIETFTIGDYHALALTKKGEVYGWGNNEYFRVGTAESQGILAPTFVYNGVDPALEIACGHYHSACRTRSGAVYCWGNEDILGIGSHTKRPIAIQKVKKVIGKLKCTGISCCRSSTVAVFENGEVYAWGYNGYGQLGIGSKDDQRIPVKVELGNTAIRKVACGSHHTVALSVDGSLYVWGYNAGGQLGLGHKNAQLSPSCHSNLRETFGPILEIASSGDVSAVMTENSKVLMWGPGGDDSPTVPTEVPCESIQDVFAAWTKISMTPVPLVVISNGDWTTNSTARKSESASGWAGNLVNTIAEHFNNPLHADVKFLVGSETIHAHRLVLKFQSDYFRAMFEGAWKDSGEKIKVSKYRYSVYEAFLRYFYTGELNLPPVEALELLELAEASSEDALKIKCQRRVQNEVAVENCASIYEAAVRSNARELEDFCSRFAADNLTAVMQTEAFAALPNDMVRRFFSEVAKQGAFKK